MKGIASKYSEQLRQLDFPQKSNYIAVTVKDSQGMVLARFIKGDVEQVKQASYRLALGCGTILSSLSDAVAKAKYKWEESVLPEYAELLGKYTGTEEEIWYQFEQEMKEVYLKGVNEDTQDEFYQKCWGFSKSRSEDMGGIEELYELFAGYLPKTVDK